MPELEIRIIVFREGDWWVAQCLEYDLATQTRRLDDMPTELLRLLVIQVASNQRLGVEPFHGFSEAPRRFWRLYEEAKVRLESVQPLEAPTSAGLRIAEIRVSA